MLSTLRSGAQSVVMKLLLTGMLGMAMLGLMFMDVQGVFRGGIRDDTVARIGRQKISAQEFQQVAERQMRQQQIPRAIAVQIGIPRQILTREIDDRIYAMAARDNGYIVGDTAAARRIRDIMQPLVDQGMTEEDALQQLQYNAGLSEHSLLRVVATEMATQEFLETITAGAQPPRRLVADSLAFRNERRRAEYFTLTAADAGRIDPPDDAELQAYYQSVAARFATPEYRDVAVLLLDGKAFGIDSAVTEDEMRAHYEDHVDSYTVPETRRIAQVVAGDEDTARAIRDAAAASRDLQKAAAGRGSFIAARSYTRDDVPEELAEAAFGAAKGEITAPVHSPMGWHVMHVLDVSPEKVGAYEEVKARIKEDLFAHKAADLLYEKANQADDIIAGGGGIDDVAREFGVQPVILEKIDITGTNPDGKAVDRTLPQFGRAVAQAFRLQPGQASQLIETEDGGFVVAGVQKIYPPEERPLAEVRDKVARAWREKQVANRLDKLAAELNERLKLGGAFADIAREYGKIPATTKFLTREDDAAAAGLDRGFIPALFAMTATGETAAITGDKSVIVLRHAARKTEPPRTEDGAEETEALKAQLRRTLQNDILEQYRMHLVDKYDVEVNEDLVRDLFKPTEEDMAALMGG